MVAMTASWTVPASGAQFPFGPCFALSPPPRSSPTSPSPSPRAAPVRSPCDTRAYVHASPAACTWPVHVYRYVHEATKRATFRRACFLRVSAPVGQTNRPAPTSSNQPVRRPLRLRAHSLVFSLLLSLSSLSFFPSRLASAPSTLAFSFWFGCRDSPPTLDFSYKWRKKERIRSRGCALSKSNDYHSFTPLTVAVIQARIESSIIDYRRLNKKIKYPARIGHFKSIDKNWDVWVSDFYLSFIGKSLLKSVPAKAVKRWVIKVFVFFSFSSFFQVHTIKIWDSPERSYQRLQIRLNLSYTYIHISTDFVEFARLCHSRSTMFSRAARASSMLSLRRRELRHASWPHACRPLLLSRHFARGETQSCLRYQTIFSKLQVIYNMFFSLRHNYLQGFFHLEIIARLAYLDN